ncbi:hypothetical protein C8Q76DRAFT_203093 [Earliella scabrosa]|nr:hypothetical protein C8Q76DRAFT_203093 [Earliella scabrosa]
MTDPDSLVCSSQLTFVFCPPLADPTWLPGRLTAAAPRHHGPTGRIGDLPNLVPPPMAHAFVERSKLNSPDFLSCAMGNLAGLHNPELAPHVTNCCTRQTSLHDSLQELSAIGGSNNASCCDASVEPDSCSFTQHARALRRKHRGVVGLGRHNGMDHDDERIGTGTWSSSMRSSSATPCCGSATRPTRACATRSIQSITVVGPMLAYAGKRSGLGSRPALSRTFHYWRPGESDCACRPQSASCSSLPLPSLEVVHKSSFTYAQPLRTLRSESATYGGSCATGQTVD